MYVELKQNKTVTSGQNFTLCN